MDRDDLLPAPGRGAYDRALSRGERDVQHRERLLLAASEVLWQGPLTVARVAAHAGVGRSTFYEFFDNPAHLLDQLEQRVLRGLQASLGAAFASVAAPRERSSALAHAWLGAIEPRPAEARVALTPRATTELLSPAGKVLHAALVAHAAAARSSGEGGLSNVDEATLLAAAAAVEVVSRQHLAGPKLAAPQHVLTELLTKLLR